MTDTTARPLTRAELDAIRQRAEAATPGPWNECGASEGRCQCGQVWSKPADAPVATCNKEWGDGPDMVYGSLPEGHRENNAIFIAAARTDVPTLLAHIDALEAALRDMLAPVYPLPRETLERARALLSAGDAAQDA